MKQGISRKVLMAAALVSVLAVGFVDAGSSSGTQIQSTASIDTQVEQKASASPAGTSSAGVRNPGRLSGIVGWVKRVIMLADGLLYSTTGSG